MAQDGDYPFVVKVWNRMNVSELNTNILTVTFNYYSYGEKYYEKKGEEGEPAAVEAKELKAKTCTITPGEFLAFPLYWDDEYLEIKFEGNISTTSGYHTIWAGIKAGCEFNKKGGFIFTPAFGKAKDEKYASIKGQYRGGAWRIENSVNDWILKINKLVPDPEEENITIGEDPPA
jgi:hypothetical protein